MYFAIGVEVKVRAVQSEQSKMSAEERRLERILSKPTKVSTNSDAVILHKIYTHTYVYIYILASYYSVMVSIK